MAYDSEKYLGDSQREQGTISGLRNSQKTAGGTQAKEQHACQISAETTTALDLEDSQRAYKAAREGDRLQSPKDQAW